MGLAEKRERKAADDGWLPKRQAELAGIVGAAIPYEVDWESFEGDSKGLNWLEHNGPHQVNGAFRGVCHDDIGKEAAAEGVKRIVFRNVAEAGGKVMTLEDGVLTLQCAYAQSPGGRFDILRIKEFLEGAL